MSEVLNEVGTFLAAAGLGLTLDQSLFKSYMPDDPLIASTTVAAILESPHPAADEVFGQDGVLRLRFQVVVRGPDYPTAYAKARDIRAALHAVSNQTLSGAWYLRIQALQSRPFPLGPPDSKHRWRLAVNYEASRAP